LIKKKKKELVNSHENYIISKTIVKDLPIKSSCDQFLALGKRQKSAKCNKEELVHQYKENDTTTDIFKIQQ
jgi:hypothetical protein